ncbi:MAG: hypothetical protein GQ563_09730, partial [Desulfuromusa sp.]|nr:hypothetical protein [Desulfuromusa sp.]
MEKLTNLLRAIDQTVLGVSITRLIIAFAVLFAALLLKRIIAHIFTNTLLKAAEKTRSEMDDLLIKNLKKPAELLVV